MYTPHSITVGWLQQSSLMTDSTAHSAIFPTNKMLEHGERWNTRTKKMYQSTSACKRFYEFPFFFLICLCSMLLLLLFLFPLLINGVLQWLYSEDTHCETIYAGERVKRLHQCPFDVSGKSASLLMLTNGIHLPSKICEIIVAKIRSGEQNLKKNVNHLITKRAWSSTSARSHVC